MRQNSLASQVQDDLFASKSIRQALKLWQKLPQLGEHPLAKLNLVEVTREQEGYEKSARGYGQALRALLRQQIESLKPNGEEPASYEELGPLSGAPLRHWQQYLILTQKYMGGKRRKYVQESWQIGQGTYNKRQKEVFERLGNLLRKEERECVRLPPVTFVTPVPPKALFVGVPQKPEYFVGRDELLEALSMQLMRGQNVALQGTAGIGKTTLAVMLAHTHTLLEHFSDGVLWGTVGQEPNVLRVLGRWGKALGAPDVSHLRSEAERAQAVKDAIGQRRMLLVIDDAWDEEAALWLRVGGPYCTHLLTTRDLAITRRVRAQAVSVPTLRDELAFDLLKKLAPEACAVDPTKAQEVAHSVGGLPLAIELLGGYLAAPEHSLFPELAFEALAEMSDARRRLQLASRRLGSFRGAEVSLQETIQFSLAHLPASVVDGFHALGAFAAKPADFSLEAAKAVTAAETRSLAILVARHLVERAGERLTLHQTLADVAQSQLEQSALKRHRAYFLTFAQANGGCHPEAWDKLEKELPNLLLAAKRTAKVKDLHGMIAFEETLIHHGQLLYIRSYYQEAIELLSQSLAVQKVKKEPQYQARTLNKQAFFYNRLNQNKQAQKKAKDAYRIAITLNDQEQQADSFKYLGQIFNARGEAKQAHDYHKEELKLRLALNRLPQLADCYNGLGVVGSAIGHYVSTKGYFEQALHIFQEINYQPGILRALGNRGLSSLYMGEYAQAKQDFECVLKQSQELDHHYNSARMLMNLGVLHTYLSEYRLALPFLTEALLLWRKMKRASSEALTLGTLAEVHSGLGNFQEAKTYLEEAQVKMLQIENKELEIDHFNKWGVMTYEQGDYDGALEAYQKGAALIEESELRYYAIVRNKLGLSRTYLAKGTAQDLERARHYARQAVALCREMQLAGNEPCAHVYLGKANLLLGDYATALKNGQDAIGLLEKQEAIHGSQDEINCHIVDILGANKQR